MAVSERRRGLHAPAASKQPRSWQRLCALAVVWQRVVIVVEGRDDAMTFGRSLTRLWLAAGVSRANLIRLRMSRQAAGGNSRAGCVRRQGPHGPCTSHLGLCTIVALARGSSAFRAWTTTPSISHSGDWNVSFESAVGCIVVAGTMIT